MMCGIINAEQMQSIYSSLSQLHIYLFYIVQRKEIGE